METVNYILHTIRDYLLPRTFDQLFYQLQSTKPERPTIDPISSYDSIYRIAIETIFSKSLDAILCLQFAWEANCRPTSGVGKLNIVLWAKGAIVGRGNTNCIKVRVMQLRSLSSQSIVTQMFQWNYRQNIYIFIYIYGLGIKKIFVKQCFNIVMLIHFIYV